MYGNDISRLSYKELQALALRYRVPGNIKKKLLIKVLQAAKGGNEGEVDRLLHDLKQNRKKKVRKAKISKLSITSTPLHSPDYSMADDYYCPQQPLYQWVSAEEEIGSREDENRIPHYEEFRQFLLKKIQREFQTYDTNNNQIEESAIVDLRTSAGTSNMHTIAVDNNSYTRPNIIPVNCSESYIYTPADHVEYQMLEDSSGNTHGPVLLKKMLQAPVGANLGEIASPVFNSYRVCSMEQYQSNNVLDNSDTLTAESDNNDECNYESNTEYYGLLNNDKDTYLLSGPHFVKNIQGADQENSSVLTGDNVNVNQYKYTYPNTDAHQNHQNWSTTNVVENTDGNCMVSVMHTTSKLFHTVYYDNAGLNKVVNDENMNYQYRVTENGTGFNSNQNIFNLNPSEDNQYCDPSIIPNLQSDSNNTYYFQNLKQTEVANGEYIQNINSLTNANTEQDTNSSASQQVFLPDVQQNYQYSYTHENQETNIPLDEKVEQEQNNNVVPTDQRFNIHKESHLSRVEASSAGILDPFWPKWSAKSTSDTTLENILNLSVSKHLDYSKLDQTSCVYCYTAPVVTQKPVSSSSFSQKKKFIAEHRHHSFSPYWLLYNDTSSGMRMANLRSATEESTKAQVAQMTSNSNSNSDIKESLEESEDSITDVWINNYKNYQTSAQKDLNICEDINVEVTDCLFSAINTESHGSNVENISVSQTQEGDSY